jgi:BASS family bile acid:Na+ symporter
VDLKQLLTLAFQVSILLTVFGFGLQAASQDLLFVVRRPGLLWRSLFSVLVIVPVIAIVLIGLFDFRHTVEVAMLALAISPLPPFLPAKEAKAGGQQSYAIGLMATLALLSIASVPLVVELLARFFDRTFAMPPGRIARLVMFSTLIPLAAGIAVRALLPGIAQRSARAVGMVAKVLLSVAALVLIAASWRAIWAVVGDGSVPAIVAFVGAGLTAGHLLGGPDPADSVVLALSSAGRHPAIALSISAANFPDDRFGGTIMLYLIVNTMVGAAYLAWRRAQTATSISHA